MKRQEETIQKYGELDSTVVYVYVYIIASHFSVSNYCVGKKESSVLCMLKVGGANEHDVTSAVNR